MSTTSSIDGAGRLGKSRTETTRLCQSEDCGKPNFKGCWWCRRGRNCENPIVGERGESQFLRFRGERHTMCNPCAATVRKKYPFALAGEGRDKNLQAT